MIFPLFQQRAVGVRSGARITLLPALVTLAMVVAGFDVRGAARVDFNRDIRPLLSDNCFACHGPDEKHREADLRLDTREGLFVSADGQPPVKAGDAKGSELWRRVAASDPDDLMPPPESHKKLDREEKELIRRWIEEGAAFGGHWAFNPVAPVDVPKVRSSRGIRNDVDRFIRAKLDAKRLSPSSEASKEILIRRVTLDLTGLPPTLDEVDAFLKDRSPDAYEKVVDRLLASSRYGEHMARYWLDAARYGDTHGLHLDNERSMWPYRDWVIQAFNENLPFDQFTLWQLAGDLLPNATRNQKIASGFNRCNVTTSEGGSINEEFLVRYAVDRTETTAAVWMGLTAGCAVCHDHKFDPITAKDFYSMYAFFYSAADPAMDGNRVDTPPILKLTTPEQEEELARIGVDLAAVRKSIADELEGYEYTDPASLTPPPPKIARDTVWLDDAIPEGASPVGNGKPFQFVEAGDGVKPFSGTKALRRKADEAVSQDYFEGAKQPLVVNANTKLYAHVYLDPADPPKAIMLQYHAGTESWRYRANWGNQHVIGFGSTSDKTKTLMGDLPKTGEWVRLEFTPARLGMKPGTKLDGMAFVQFGGTVYWDKAGMVYESEPAKDPLLSLSVWLKQNQGKASKDFPQDVAQILRSVKPEDRTPEQDKRLRNYYLEFISMAPEALLAPHRERRQKLEAEQAAIDKEVPVTFVMADLPKPREAFVLARGQYDKPTDRVAPAVPGWLQPVPEMALSNRLDLAQWLVDPRHPLTARVTVNRFWQQFFGTGLVKSSNDFGSQGEPPSHPELLDWLAMHFMRGDGISEMADGRRQSPTPDSQLPSASPWDMKAFAKMLVTSATYRQDSTVTSKLLALDPENRLLARGPRFRLDAESIRDSALAVSGLLIPTIGGPPVKPYQPENIWEPVAYSGSNTRFYKQDTGASLYRRSLYTFVKRTAPAPGMTTLDAPSRESFCVRRERSNTPLQALLLMNDVQYFEAARVFAERMLKHGGTTPRARLEWGFRVATSRRPDKGELDTLDRALDAQLKRYTADAEAAKQAVTVGNSKRDLDLPLSEVAAYTMVANLLLNLDEAVTKN